MIIGLLPVAVFAEGETKITSLDFTVKNYEAFNKANEVSVLPSDKEKIEWEDKYETSFVLCTQIGDLDKIDASILQEDSELEKDTTYYMAVLIRAKENYSADELKAENVNFAFADGKTVTAEEIYSIGPDSEKLYVAAAKLPVLMDYMTCTIPFQKIVKQNGDKAPGEQEFLLDVFSAGSGSKEDYKDIEISASIKTKGEGIFDGAIIIAGASSKVAAFLNEGFIVRERTGNAAGWTYSDDVWFVRHTSPTSEDPFGNTEFYRAYPNAEAESGYKPDLIHPYDGISFENVYTVNEETTTTEEVTTPETTTAQEVTTSEGTSPEKTTADNTKPITGDNNNLVLWIVIIVIAAVIVVAAVIIAKKKNNKGR